MLDNLTNRLAGIVKTLRGQSRFTEENIAEALRDVRMALLEADVGLPVVRVVVPGLRHFWARFGPGRLYEVPVTQGWIPRPLDESELNPFVVQF